MTESITVTREQVKREMRDFLQAFRQEIPRDLQQTTGINYLALSFTTGLFNAVKAREEGETAIHAVTVVKETYQHDRGYHGREIASGHKAVCSCGWQSKYGNNSLAAESGKAHRADTYREEPRG